jgi:1-deoxy-D-xylulose-5-phosphate reductoisomerase
VAILGSTGSIGTQALEFVRENERYLSAVCLACKKNVDLLIRQIREFHPEAVAVADEEGARRVRALFPKLEVYSGEGAAARLAAEQDYSVLLNALVGISGLRPTAAAMETLSRNGGYIALANKETLAAGGRLITEMAWLGGVPIVPVDSEHGAVYQCMTPWPSGGEDGAEGMAGPPAVGNVPTAGPVSRLILTASGGPFRGRTREELVHVTVKDALKHPNWDMGVKVTIDSATLLNKGLEVIEARWLFGLPSKQIEVLVHPQSIVHSMVCYTDGSVIAQLGVPDMKVPIAYALAWPSRWTTNVPTPDFAALGGLTFEEPDMETFKCLRLAREALKQSDRLGSDNETIVLNGAAEALTTAFVEGRIGFLDIGDFLEAIMEQNAPRKTADLEEIIGIDAEARRSAETLIANRARLV